MRCVISSWGVPVSVRTLPAPCAAAFLFFGLTSDAFAAVTVQIDKSSQRMTVSVDGQTRHVWKVSTGRSGFGTPNGHFRPQRMHRSWFSRKYYNSPMPYSIFFHGGFAIHGSNEIRRLGGPASHGCVRLHPSNAAALYALVQKEGAGSTQIVITGSSPMTHVAARLAPRNAGYRTEATAQPASGWQSYSYQPQYYLNGFSR
jgi:lipoprotein-anchoring transpeptidase ErfK/SrfK